MVLVVALSAASSLPAQEDSASLTALRVAAEKGQADAQYELGILYEFGYRFPDHLLSAYAWYSRAADQGNPAAAQRRDLLKAQLNPRDLERAQSPSPSATAPGSR
jgi:TPR repeat protein